MKRIVYANIFTIIILSCLLTTSFSAPCYGIKTPQKKRIFLGTQTHYIIHRNLENNYGKVRSLQHFLLLSWGITDWLSLDLKGGTGYIKQHPYNSDEIDYNSSFAGGYGFRIKIWEDETATTKTVFGFQHISVHPYSSDINGVNYKAVLDDWQVSLLISKNLDNITPYLGTKWSRIDYINWINDKRERIMSDLTKSLGIIIGLDYQLRKNIWLNMETHFLDEKAGSIAIMFAL
ncbi:MAG: hypothetical protein NC822_04725 [Candidatus Omnitrophica bacterium]|nr:hypothetical protein [Candidatus Omnitrophota bacterium]MCM8827246.1 hypothetical protein [Candidatus Omnitrophota bacterium]